MCIIARIIAHIVHNSTHNSDEISEISARYERDLNARDDVVASAVVARTAVVRMVAARAAEIRVAAGSAVARVANWRAGDASGGL